MAFSIGKSAPTVVVASVVSYCVWPSAAAHLGTAEEQGAKTPQIAASQLSPKILPPPVRDPFRPAAALAKEEAKPGSGQKNGKSPGPAGPAGKVAGRTAVRPAPSRTVAVPGAAAAGRGSQAQPGVLPGVPSLNAISICGPQRAAIINGRLYVPGATLLVQDPSASPSVIREILPDKVVLESGGKTSDLTFSDASARSGRQATGAKKATKASAASGAARTAEAPKRAPPGRSGSKAKPRSGR